MTSSQQELWVLRLQWASLGRNTIQRLLPFQGWRSSELCVTFLGGRDNQEPYTWISPEPSCVFLPYYPAMYITVSLYLRCHYSYMLNPISPFSKLLHLAGMAGVGVGLEDVQYHIQPNISG